MPIVRATQADHQALLNLLRSARLRFANFGLEDLPDLLADSESVLGVTNDVLWGFLCLQTEERPDTLPTEAPRRSYLRSLALRSGYPPSQYASPLLAAAVDRLLQHKEPVQVITYGGESWLFNVLHGLDFTIADQVQFYELSQPHHQLHWLPPNNSAASLLPAESRHLRNLAELDAAAFPPLWHFGHKDMLEMFVRTRLQLAVQDENILGYSAAIVNSSKELQLARLAVHPHFQGRGIGRQLLRDVVEYAASSQFQRIILNTQTANERSQRLYTAFGFRPTSKPVPVLTMTVGEMQPAAP